MSTGWQHSWKFDNELSWAGTNWPQLSIRAEGEVASNSGGWLSYVPTTCVYTARLCSLVLLMSSPRGASSIWAHPSYGLENVIEPSTWGAVLASWSLDVNDEVLSQSGPGSTPKAVVWKVCNSLLQSIWLWFRTYGSTLWFSSRGYGKSTCHLFPPLTPLIL